MSSGLEHALRLPLLGLPLTMYTNSRALSQLLEQERPLGHWAGLPAEQIDPGPQLQIDLLLGPAEARSGGMGIYRHGELALAGDGARVMLADGARGYGLACLPAEPPADAVTALWDLAQLLARRRGRLPLSGAALAHAGRAVLLVGADVTPLVQACVARGMGVLARQVVHLSAGPAGPRVWGDGVGGELLCCPGPPTLCALEQAVTRASQIRPLPVEESGLGLDRAALRAAYRLQAGVDLAMAAALVEHVA